MSPFRALTVLAFLATLIPPGEPAAAQTVDESLYQNLAWRHIGPFRGGRSVAATGVTSDPLTYYFGGVGSGVWKTADAGNTWAHVSDSTFGTSSVGAIAVAESDPNVVYVGMGEHAPRGVMTSHGDGVYRSTDAGKTWTHMGLERTRHISRIRVHPKNPDLVYVAAQGAAYGESEDRGIYRSRDGGETWEQLLYVGTSASASELAMDPTNPRILYASFWDHVRYPWQVRSGGEGSGFWKSTDGGDTWDEINEGLPDLMGKTAIDVSPTKPERLFAMIEADPGGGLYRSDDAGDSWTLMTEDWTLRARAWYYTEVFADPRDENTVYVLGAPMMRSVDGGKTFQRVSTPHGDNHDLWINPTDSRIMINANDGGANVSFNGGESWSTQTNQPTVQFYRVNTDNQFPYRVYGGQQDNSSVAIASAGQGGIGARHWYPVGGCESAIPGFDKDNPRYVYSGCYMGIMSEYDHRTGATRNTQAYPTIPIALQASEMKYRFNWSAPILVSQFNPSTIYHGANVLLKSTDRGRSWVEASPDLTRNQADKQGYGGGPITNEGAGGEIYGTLAYVAESPLQEGLIWTGSDDGKVWMTRDGGANWNDVTPDGLPEGLVNTVDPSPHDPATAYVAFTRYKFDDFTPRAFKTNDYGESWTEISDGFGPEHFVRVVREDPVRRGLLYAGTEAGLYISFDDGAQWQPAQLNLPLTPITDLQIQTQMNDLVASTAGWGFWILDDLSPLQQVDDVQGTTAAAHLYSPRDAYRVAGGWGEGRGGNVGQNPPNGAVIDFYLEADPEEGDEENGDEEEDEEGVEEEPTAAVRIDILGGGGEVIRTYSTEPDEEAFEEELEAEAGMNRLVWDLRHPDVYRVPDLYIWGDLQGRRVVPGTYTVRLTVGDEEQTRPLKILKDPRSETTQAQYEEQDALLAQLLAEAEAIHRSVVQLGQVRSQVEGILDRIDEAEETARVFEVGGALVDSLTAVEDSLVQWGTVDGQTVLNAPSRLNLQYVYLMGTVEGSDEGPNEGAREFMGDLNVRWRAHEAKLDVLLTDGVDEFNEAVEAAGIPPVEKPNRKKPIT